MRVDKFINLIDEEVAAIEHRRKIEIMKGLCKSHTRLATTNKNHLLMNQISRDFEPTFTEETKNCYIMKWVNDDEVKVWRKPGNCCCDSDVNTHCRQCNACSYEYKCNCKESQPGVCCIHVHYVKENIDEGSDDVLDLAYTFSDIEIDENVQSRVFASSDVEEVGHRQTSSSHNSQLDHNKRIQMKSLQENLDFLSLHAGILMKSKTMETVQKFDAICQEVEKLTNQFKADSDCLLSLTPSRDAARKPSKKGETMRQKVGLPNRKKRRLNYHFNAENVEIQENDINFCVSCKMENPEDDNPIVSWLGCPNCKLWVHETCSMNNGGKCNICDGLNVEIELFDPVKLVLFAQISIL